MPLNCPHETWSAKKLPRSDGISFLREFCTQCGRSFSGTRLGHALPSISDVDLPVLSFKYKDKKLGEIALLNPDYLRWLVVESKSSDRVKKSAARILCDRPYSPPVEGDVYGVERCYDPAFGWECIRQVLADPDKTVVDNSTLQPI